MNRKIYAGDMSTHPIVQHLTWSEAQVLQGRDEQGNSKGTDVSGKSILFRPPLIIPHKRKAGIYYALVSRDKILVALKRKIPLQLPIAGGSCTIRKTHFSNERGSGFYYEHRAKVCVAYASQKATAEAGVDQQAAPTPALAVAAEKRDNLIAFPSRVRTKESKQAA